MKKIVRKMLNSLPKQWQKKINEIRYHFLVKKEIRQWEKNGKLNPPPVPVKHKNLLKIARENKIKNFVETGTYLGSTVNALKDQFENIFSVELSEELYQKAKIKFSEYSHIRLICADSGEALKEIMFSLNEPTLFWLDAHYSSGITARGRKDTPIIEELLVILNDNINHYILIDDARDFRGSGDYPSINEIVSFVEEKKPNAFHIDVHDDAIRIIPKKKI